LNTLNDQNEFLMRTLYFALVCCTLSCNQGPGRPNENAPKTTRLPASELKKPWALVSFNGDTTGFAVMYPVQKPYIVIDSFKSAVYGNTGCNAFGGAAQVKGDSLKFFTPFEMTAIGCPGGGEEKFVRLMGRISGYAMKGDTLELLEGTAPVLSFLKKK
jgi:heat shock protein HslJ